MTATTEPSERAVEAASHAFDAYWNDEDQTAPCECCKGRGYLYFGSDPEHCGECGGLGTFHNGTQEGAIAAALQAAYATDETIAALRRDAERYRWLRQCPNNVREDNYALCGLLKRDEYLDGAIDAALRQAETEGGG